VWPLQLLVVSLLGWLRREQHDIIHYLREENRVLRAQLQNQRLRLTDDDRRRLAFRGAATVRGLVTYYTLFVIELHSRRVRIVGSTPNPNEAFMRQMVRAVTDACDGELSDRRILICDRDRKWSTDVRDLLETAGVRTLQIPFRAPNCNAHAERFVRSIKEECLNRLIPLGERHVRRAVAEFVAHYHTERNHQGLANELIEAECHQDGGRVRRRERLGGLLNYYF